MPPSEQAHSFQAPKGTRDFYPQDLLKKRYIEKMWRDTSIRHGFEEIDGPTFEHLDLYTVKSGEGIISELFSFRREGGEKDYALRPEFTPTLARMYAAKAGSLPKPTKWFWQQNCYRAERQQRGRLREFAQWNVDSIGDPSGEIADVEIISCCVSLLQSLDLTSEDVRIHLNSRKIVYEILSRIGVSENGFEKATDALDSLKKVPERSVLEVLEALGADPTSAAKLIDVCMFPFRTPDYQTRLGFAINGESLPSEKALNDFGLTDWVLFDLSITRGLAYYTGMVFEVHEANGKERAIAGGGRYDKLIEMFGGPPTPAVGFGMGDVVLSLVLQDRGLMPEGKDLLDKLSAPSASLRPDVFVIANDNPDSIAALRPLVAQLRRGSNGQKPLHARHTYKTTKNIGKLLQEATTLHARFAAIIENATEATLKDLTTGEQSKLPLNEIATRIAQP